MSLRQNLFPNPKFAVNITDSITQYGPTDPTTGVQYSQDSAHFVAPGSKSLQIEAGVNGDQYIDGGVMINVPVAPATYTASVYIATKSNGSGGGIQNAHFVCRDSSSNVVGSQVHVTSDTAGAFSRYSITWTQSAYDTITVLIGLGSYGSASQGLAWFTDMQFEFSSSPTSYFDGDSIASGYAYSWEGTANNSISDENTGTTATSYGNFFRLF